MRQLFGIIDINTHPDGISGCLTLRVCRLYGSRPPTFRLQFYGCPNQGGSGGGTERLHAEEGPRSAPEGRHRHRRIKRGEYSCVAKIT